MSRPRDGSTRSRVLAFFAERPDEELDYDSLCAKFDIEYRKAVEVVKYMKARGELEAVHVIRLPAKGRAS